MSDNNNEGFTFQEQQELLDIKNRYFTLKEKHNNLKVLVEITKRESTRLIGKASIIFWLSFFALGVMIGIEYPDFVDSGWFILYLIGGIALFVVTILLCSREHDNYATEEREVYQQMCKAKREYEKIQHRISDSSLIPPKNQETSKTTSEKKEPPKQYVRTYPPSSPVVPFHAEEPYKLHFAYSPSSIDGGNFSDFDKERIALIMSIIDSGVSKYLGFSDKVLVDYDFLPINESSDPSFAKLYQSRCLSLNKELKKYGLELWMYNNRAVLSIPVDYALSLPQKYGTPVLSYLTAYCGLRIDFA